MTWRGYSIFGLLLIILGALMLAPATMSYFAGDGAAFGSFAICAMICVVTGGLLTLAQYRAKPRSETVAEFGTLLAFYLLAPFLAAAPISIVSPVLSYEAAYFEMVSTFTTTGATVFDRLDEVRPAIHLWRGLTAWMGGFVALVMAFALLAPRNLGGFEVRGDQGRSGAVGRLTGAPEWAGGRGSEASADRIAAAIGMVLPIYAALTFGLAVVLAALGLAPLNAAVAAMGVLSTSGVKATEESAFAVGGPAAEIVVVLFLVLAATRRTYGAAGQGALNWGLMRRDAELRILLIIALAATTWLFLRHWIGALELDDAGGFSVRALWGAFFTVISFATTTGYESAYWSDARAWSGLDNPSLILFGLVLIGGGIATTAGGVKLLRAYALFNHGVREMERLVRPSSIAGSGARKRGLRREGAQIAWIFVMLYLVALAAVMLTLSIFGLSFQEALAASIAALTNTGPVFTAVTEDGSWLTSLTPEARAVAAVGMVLGRVELLALIAMLNPDNWR
ncbi:MAG: potassium transporter TrkG [Pseudomonadota bacterium]